MEWHHLVYNLVLASIITAALIAIPLALFVTVRLFRALPQYRPSKSTRNAISDTIASTSTSSLSNDTFKLRSRTTTSSLSPSSFKCATTIFLGSGGHTAEMLQLVSGLDVIKYSPRHYVVGWDDESSIEKVHRLEAIRGEKDITIAFQKGQDQDPEGYTIHRIPRSRHVHQSMLTTPFTLAKSLLVAMPLIKRLTCLSVKQRRMQVDTNSVQSNGIKKSILLMNGPGTCFALALAVIGARMVGVPDEATPDLIFVESFARVKTMSLAGRLLYPLCDVFLVQWPELASNWTAGIYAKRTPRPKSRVVKEQKLKVSRNNVSPTPEQVAKSKDRQWKTLDEKSASSGSSSPQRKRIQSTSVSVTSLERGSRNPQYEHSFAPGFASSYRVKSARLGGAPSMTGNSGRDKAAAAERMLVDAGAKRMTGPKVRGFVPVRFALKSIASDVNLNLVSNRKVPGFMKAKKSTGAEAVNEPIFAETDESVQEMLDKVANSRFESMGLHPDVENGLKNLLGLAGSSKGAADVESTEIRPTEIQAMTIPAAIDPSKKSPYTLCAAETGSGKTLAYLIPVLHELKVQEDKAVQAFKDQGGIDHEESKVRALSTVRLYNQPRAVILLPSRELVAQISKVLKELSHTAKLRTIKISHTTTPKSVIQRLESGPVDIIVATPAALMDYLPQEEKHRRRGHKGRGEDGEDRKVRGSARLFEENQLSLASLRHLVIDEADSMFDRGFGSEVTKIVKQAKDVVSPGLGSNGKCKIMVVSATLPKKVSDTLDETLPGILKVTTPSLHKSLPGLHQTFLDLKPYFGNRPKAILDILAKQQKVTESTKRGENTLIFCNTKHSCELLYQHLKASNVPGVLGVLHGDAVNRDEILEQFKDDSFIPPLLTNKGNNSGAAVAAPAKSGVAKGKILISTDIASRGIDTTAVQHVVLYDFPITIVDYLHRVGRTARGGRGGRATSLVGRKDRNMAERIMVGIRMGKVLS
ncbi:RNA helicase [Mortierella polycephala]|uniref:RNA helicase n=1 Tax=Mortierella polycephala TaxID=41804 RepID=A0A9P6PTV9_9FUNG|nr:RNA helicase [Mortierella polycephala]